MYPDYQSTIVLNNNKKLFSFSDRTEIFNKQRKNGFIIGFDNKFNEVRILSKQIFKIIDFDINRDL
ncbi:hypothetical protein LPB09_04930 [Staphylococcus pseudintermedius]|uniref:hypothetical protein n=1 Tax=Staphylococcus pseudintermedius TaxID=283734 RepID=UPI0011223662|nr:hypothetical protein [Staphylococcus pseudintermedius]TPD24860.1 hypothetical protein DJ449_07905 [Staphylococcus pseudintermedius]